MDFIPYSCQNIDEADIEAVVAVLRAPFLTQGPEVPAFEAEFAALHGVAHGVAVSNATAALHLGCLALGVEPGHRVWTSPNSFLASANAARYCGATVDFVDIDPLTRNLSVAALRAKLAQAAAEGTLPQLLIPVHFAGRAADMDAILATARRHGLKVVEDAAHALPTTCGGRRVGTLDSDVTVFSFYANKTITTGEGGMAVTRDPALAARMKVMRLHGINRDAFDRFTAQVPSWYYEIVAPGFKYNLTDIAAALGIHQLKRAQAFRDARARIVARYDALLADLPLVLPPQPAAGDVHSWHLYVLRLADDAPVDRDAVVEALFAAGIGCSVHYIPLHQHPYWRARYGLRAEDFPHSQRAYERTFSLPLYSRMTEADAERVAGVLRGVLTR